jgi:hypothetical protein
MAIVAGAVNEPGNRKAFKVPCSWVVRWLTKQRLDLLGGIVWDDESHSATVSAAKSTNRFLALDPGENYVRETGIGIMLTRELARAGLR